MKRRGSGILLHITSLPSSFGIGDLGPWAYKFADFLSETKQGFWQILPLNPTIMSRANSPYSSPSAFAGNPLLISLELLIEDGYLSRSDVKKDSSLSDRRVNYKAATQYKWGRFSTAYENFKGMREKNFEFEKFCTDNSHWLDDYALFVSLKEEFYGADWSYWPSDIRDRKAKRLQELRGKLRDRIEMEKFLQYIFFKQWFSLKDYCNSRNIQIIGDIPLYVSYDSSDVWTDPEVFKLDKKKKPAFVSGVPPDFFSKTGQLWGNPVYDWDFLKRTGYSWWVKRMEHNLRLCNIIRLDHFRGLVAYWEVPAGEKTAINGKWVGVPTEDFFRTLYKHFPYLPIIAEDLGVITPDMREVMRFFGFPGMKLLLFGFGGGEFAVEDYVPHNHVKDCVVYTGTHDNNTVKGWFRKEANSEDKERLSRYLGKQIREKNVHWEFIRLGMMSVANVAIFPMQDVLGLGEEAIMNLPSSTKGNWEWRLLPNQITPSLKKSLLEMTEIYGRV
ncbi:MAG TPA: 4-alpha-glucanotransferase [Thermodesulfobacteriota bacterium]|nr:4-alpha-glucanotransferase [Thermodesulfobacteriota bacterium]